MPSHRQCECLLLRIQVSSQDRFIKYKQKTVTKTEKQTNDIANGWYTKEDMAKILKWPATLQCMQTIQSNYSAHAPLQI